MSREGTVLVVGGGNTGFQIAKELAATHKVLPRGRLAPDAASTESPRPRPVLVADEDGSAQQDGRVAAWSASCEHRDTLIGSSPRELRQRYGVELKPRAVDASGRTVRFEDGSELDVDAVIWATGYRPDYSWIELPGVRRRRSAYVTDAESPTCQGLYFLGLTWQYTRGSALIGWVKDDAEFIAEQIKTFDDRRHKPTVDTRESGEKPGALGQRQAQRKD